jgi:hypothetical protein
MAKSIVQHVLHSWSRYGWRLWFVLVVDIFSWAIYDVLVDKFRHLQKFMTLVVTDYCGNSPLND